jgi:hypothetical protein
MYQSTMVKVGILDILLNYLSDNAPTAVQLKSIEALLYFDGSYLFNSVEHSTIPQDFFSKLEHRGFSKDDVEERNIKELVGFAQPQGQPTAIKVTRNDTIF